MEQTRQKPNIIQDFHSTIANLATQATDVIPVVGYTFLYGMVYSDKAVTVTISQGCNDTGGSVNYRYTQSFSVNATESEAIEVPIFGKFLKISIQNSSGSTATVESFFCVRGIE